MKKIQVLLTGIVGGYLFIGAIHGMVMIANDRLTCMEKGILGIFWCPESNIGFGIRHFLEVVFWPLNYL